MIFKTIFKQLKPFDYILIGLTVLLSFIPAIFTYTHLTVTSNETRIIAYVRVNGQVVDQFELSQTTPHQEKTYYPNEGQYNIVEIDSERIRVKEDNSPDQIAVMTSWISKPGQLSVCLPHNLLIEVKAIGGKNSNEEELILPL
ncbi:NusG domain II-containing protein [Streptococcus ruminantium]|uniref:NusG domain II-containing protein n=1 Tax=Streptococcus ruminantium TaxID=1917441 RepID=A0ABU1B6E8_9STRE|nr:NusG domain II-containing protein [Streptococcus ruminantium]MDQ8760161.1 NusG domain II-containing protein [Streptococcus ruminantium]MDQ8764444.1 NusG domain II-containing protein [Streptococcus ruminantium]MDQ8769411.1 NusG domain II-containing protein [Streptococcus ruminantium]MDQ8774954.1 NusG domain II-containing protein [Streptococcus ruminantium]MDQ8794676.1 NusG domain II-containing protein [Streptococcus ruminantium]